MKQTLTNWANYCILLPIKEDGETTMNEDKEIIKKILSQFTTQRDGFLYEIFEDDIFRKNHPEALWFFNAYDYD